MYHRQGYPVVSDRHNDANVIYEQVNVCAHPVPVVLQPARYVLQAASEVAVVLSVHKIGLQAEFDHMQTF